MISTAEPALHFEKMKRLQHVNIYPQIWTCKVFMCLRINLHSHEEIFFMKIKLIWDRNKKENVFQDKLSEEGY